MGRRNQNKLATSSEPTDVDGILRKHQEELDRLNRPVRTVYDWTTDSYIKVSAPTEGRVDSRVSPTVVLAGHKPNTESSRARKARKDQEKAKPTGNRGSGKRQRTA